MILKFVRKKQIFKCLVWLQIFKKKSSTLCKQKFDFLNLLGLYLGTYLGTYLGPTLEPLLEHPSLLCWWLKISGMEEETIQSTVREAHLTHNWSFNISIQKKAASLIPSISFEPFIASKTSIIPLEMTSKVFFFEIDNHLDGLIFYIPIYGNGAQKSSFEQVQHFQLG
jgi:hypothetical protein